MKRCKKLFTLLFMMALLIAFSVLQAQAASSNPGDVKKLTAKVVSETSIKLSWSKATKATGYNIYRVDNTTGRMKRVASTKSTTYTFKKLTANEKHVYRVYAYRTVNGKKVLSLNASPTVTASTYIKTAGAPTNLRVKSYGSNTANLVWSAGKNASGYYIYIYNATTKKFELVGSTKEKSYKLRKLADGTEYIVRVQSYRKVGDKIKTGGSTKNLKVTGRTFSKSALTVHGRYFKATVKSNVTGTIVGSTKKKTIKKGTAVTVASTSKSKGMVTVILKNGTQVKISGKKLSYGNLSYTTKAWSKKIMEAFVNEKGYYSKTKYLIWISQYTTTTNIFKKVNGEWKLQKSMPCIVGRLGNTPCGIYKLERKGWSYGNVVLYFTWNGSIGNAFHAYVDWHTRGAYSGGCIRLSHSNLNYLHSTCPMGTTVVSY